MLGREGVRVISIQFNFKLAITVDHIGNVYFVDPDAVEKTSADKYYSSIYQFEFSKDNFLSLWVDKIHATRLAVDSKNNLHYSVFKITV